jgi:hypothetical protein
MVDSRQDDAISEVIGFVLIIALIAIIASLYLTYVVPATGRDLEIAHMDVVQNQFLDYKTTVDSLWLNNQYNTQVSSPFTLGTNPGSTQGSFVNMPLFQPVTSGGTLLVTDTLQTDKDKIIVTATDSLINELPGDYTPSPWLVQSEPDHLYVNFSTPDISKKDFVVIKPDDAAWEVNLSTSPGLSATTLAITISKNGNPTISNMVINSAIANKTPTQSPYVIDLADNAYGLKQSFKYPITLTITPNPSGLITCKPIGYLKKTAPINVLNATMGSLEYRSNNNYWISQNYIYQFGGVFLIQDKGAVVKLLPSIKVESVNSTYGRVTIHGITIPGTTPSRVGGSSLVEVLTTLPTPNPTSDPIITHLASGVPNTKNVTITVTISRGSDSGVYVQMWKNTFDTIKQKSDLSGWITTGSSSNQAYMTIRNPVNTQPYDISLNTENNVAIVYLSPTSYS